MAATGRLHTALKIVAHGQACSALTALTGATATLLAARGVAAPTSLSAPMYMLLASLWCGHARAATQHATAAPKRDAVREAGAWLLLAVVDVEANACVVLAYSYTTLTSVMLLDCFTIPCVMVLSRIALRARYERAHVAGAGLCAVGVLATVLSDVAPAAWGGPPRSADDDARGAPSPRRRLIGDLLALGGAALYAASNVAQELLVKERGPAQLLARLGAAGALVSSCQAAALERAKLRRAASAMRRGPAAPLLAGGYVAALFCMYVGTSLFFQHGDAAAFNLSLLTSDAYALLFAALVDRRLPPPLYFVALAITATGVVVYHAVPSPTSAVAVLGRGRAPSLGGPDAPGTRSPLLRLNS